MQTHVVEVEPALVAAPDAVRPRRPRRWLHDLSHRLATIYEKGSRPRMVPRPDRPALPLRPHQARRNRGPQRPGLRPHPGDDPVDHLGLERRAPRVPTPVESLHRPRHAPGLQLAVVRLQRSLIGRLPGPAAPGLHRPGAGDPGGGRDRRLLPRAGDAAGRAGGGHGGHRLRVEWRLHGPAGMADRLGDVVGRLAVRLHHPGHAGTALAPVHHPVGGGDRRRGVRRAAGHPGGAGGGSGGVRGCDFGHPGPSDRDRVGGPTAGESGGSGRGRVRTGRPPHPAVGRTFPAGHPGGGTTCRRSAVQSRRRDQPEIQRAVPERRHLVRQHQYPRPALRAHRRLRRGHRVGPGGGGGGGAPAPAGGGGLLRPGGAVRVSRVSAPPGVPAQQSPPPGGDPVGPFKSGDGLRPGRPGRCGSGCPGPLPPPPDRAHLVRGRPGCRGGGTGPGVVVRSGSPTVRRSLHPVPQLHLAGPGGPDRGGGLGLSGGHRPLGTAPPDR